MNILATVLALLLFTGEVSVLVLRSGHKMAVSGPVRLENGTVIFRQPSGALYSLPLSEVDIPATEAANSTSVAAEEAPKPAEEPRETTKLKVSPEEKERLLRELEKSRGTPAPQRPLPSVESLSDEIDVRERDDEEYWRSQARRLEENVRRQREQIEMLKNRIRRLEDEIRTFLGMGVPPDQYGGNVLQLEDSRAMLEQAELDLAAAERELAEFHERARREGILPGWLR